MRGAPLGDRAMAAQAALVVDAMVVGVALRALVAFVERGVRLGEQPGAGGEERGGRRARGRERDRQRRRFMPGRYGAPPES
jgi:hypothetical protein